MFNRYHQSITFQNPLSTLHSPSSRCGEDDTLIPSWNYGIQTQQSQGGRLTSALISVCVKFTTHRKYFSYLYLTILSSLVPGAAGDLAWSRDGVKVHNAVLSLLSLPPVCPEPPAALPRLPLLWYTSYTESREKVLARVYLSLLFFWSRAQNQNNPADTTDNSAAIDCLQNYYSKGICLGLLPHCCPALVSLHINDTIQYLHRASFSKIINVNLKMSKFKFSKSYLRQKTLVSDWSQREWFLSDWAEMGRLVIISCACRNLPFFYTLHFGSPSHILLLMHNQV